MHAGYWSPRHPHEQHEQSAADADAAAWHGLAAHEHGDGHARYPHHYQACLMLSRDVLDGLLCVH